MLTLSLNAPSRQVLVGATDSQVTLWDLDRAHAYQQPAKPIGAPIEILTIGSGGHLAAAAGKDVIIWDDLQTPHPFTLCKADVSSLAWRQSGAADSAPPTPAELVVGLTDGGVELHQEADLKLVEAVDGMGPIAPLQVTVPAKAADFVTFGGDGVRRDWRIAPAYAIPVDPAGVAIKSALWALISDGSKFVAASSSKLVRWKLGAGAPTLDLSLNYSPARVAIEPIALVTSATGDISTILTRTPAGGSLWGANNNALSAIDLSKTAAKDETNATCLALSADGKQIAMGFASGSIYTGALTFDDHNKASLSMLTLLGDHFEVSFLRFVSNAKYLVPAARRGQIRLWNANTANEIDRKCTDAPITALDICSQPGSTMDYQLVAATLPEPTGNSLDGRLDFFTIHLDSSTASLIKVATPISVPDGGRTTTVRLSAAGDRVLTASCDRRVRVWDIKNFPQAALLEVFSHKDAITDAWIRDAATTIVLLSKESAPLFKRLRVSDYQKVLPAPVSNSLLVPETRSVLTIDDQGRSIVVSKPGAPPQRIKWSGQTKVTKLLGLTDSFELSAPGPRGSAALGSVPSPGARSTNEKNVTRVVAALDDHSIHCWDLATGDEVGSVATEANVEALTVGAAPGMVWAILSDGKKCLAVDFTTAATDSMPFSPFDLPPPLVGEPLRIGRIASLTASQDRRCAVVGCSDGNVFCYELGARLLSQAPPPPQQSFCGPIYGATLSVSGKSAAAVSASGYAYLLSNVNVDAPPVAVPLMPAMTKPTEPQVPYTISTVYPESDTAPDRFVIAGPGSRVLQLASDAETPTPYSIPTSSTQEGYFYSWIAVSQGNRLVACLNKYETAAAKTSSVELQIGRADKTSTPLIPLTGSTNWDHDDAPCYAAAFSRAGDRLAAVKTSGRLQLWQLQRDAFVPDNDVVPNPVSLDGKSSFCGLAWSCKGRRLALTAVASGGFKETDPVSTRNVWVLEVDADP